MMQYVRVISNKVPANALHLTTAKTVTISGKEAAYMHPRLLASTACCAVRICMYRSRASKFDGWSVALARSITIGNI